MVKKYGTQLKQNLLSFCCSLLVFCSIVFISSCSVQKQISKQVKPLLLKDSALTTAHIGISIWNADAEKYLFNYQGNKYFTPASNTKIFTCYAAMKYLGDSVPAARVAEKNNQTVFILPCGDPTFFHPDFPNNPFFNYLQQLPTNINVYIITSHFQEEPWGDGWAWNDYLESYMPERSFLPMYGNVLTLSGTKNHYTVYPSLSGNFVQDTVYPGNAYLGKVSRAMCANQYELLFNTKKDTSFIVPFYTDKGKVSLQLLQDIIKRKVIALPKPLLATEALSYKTIYSQPTDSLLKIMMHRSDNFFAEQTLLMVSNEKLGVMNDEMIIETLLHSDFGGIPQRPRWVDGSGLSRYNLFTPQDFVFVLNKMYHEFPWKRIATIFPTPGTGTLQNFNKNYAGRMHAKTGTLGNQVALSGFIITEKKHHYIFSILVSNHASSAQHVRKQMEQLLIYIIQHY